MTALAEIAYRSPSTITSMFIVNGDGTYTVRFYNNSTSVATMQAGVITT